MTCERIASVVCSSRIPSAETTFMPASIIVANWREKTCSAFGLTPLKTPRDADAEPSSPEPTSSICCASRPRTRSWSRAALEIRRRHLPVELEPRRIDRVVGVDRHCSRRSATPTRDLRISPSFADHVAREAPAEGRGRPGTDRAPRSDDRAVDRADGADGGLRHGVPVAPQLGAEVDRLDARRISSSSSTTRSATRRSASTRRRSPASRPRARSYDATYVADEASLDNTANDADVTISNCGSTANCLPIQTVTGHRRPPLPPRDLRPRHHEHQRQQHQLDDP